MSDEESNIDKLYIENLSYQELQKYKCYSQILKDSLNSLAELKILYVEEFNENDKIDIEKDIAILDNEIPLYEEILNLFSTICTERENYSKLSVRDDNNDDNNNDDNDTVDDIDY